MLQAGLGKIALTGSPTPLPLLPEITASNRHQRDQRKKKKIVPCISATQDTQEDTTQVDKADSSAAASFRDQ